MTITWTDVLSSNVEQIGYDDETSTLLVRWKTGKTSAYDGVPADVAEQAAKNWSVGTFLNDEIKPNFAHRYV